jgi:hypothetical protein
MKYMEATLRHITAHIGSLDTAPPPLPRRQITSTNMKHPHPPRKTKSTSNIAAATIAKPSFEVRPYKRRGRGLSIRSPK